MSVYCECCVLSGRGLCDGLIIFPGSPTECCMSEWDREASTLKRPIPTTVVEPLEKKKRFNT
jgi:hypothetical protein